MIVLVTGGRDNRNAKLHTHYLDMVRKRFRISMLIHGACGQTLGKDGKVRGIMRGTDGLAHLWAKENGVYVLPCPAEWDEHGKDAGPIRNEYMADIVCDSQDAEKLCVAFPGGVGTAHMVRTCKRDAWKIPVWDVLTPLDDVFKTQMRLVK